MPKREPRIIINKTGLLPATRTMEQVIILGGEERVESPFEAEAF